MGLTSIDKDTAGSGTGVPPWNEPLDPLTVALHQNDYALPPNGAGWRFHVTSDINITGLTAAPNGTILLMFNAGPTKKKISLRHNDAASLIANRFFLWDEVNLDLKLYESKFIRYDSLLNAGNGGWHCIGSQH